MSNAPWNPQQVNIPPTTYANAAQVLFSPWDVVVDFVHLAIVQNVTETEDGEPHIEVSAVPQATQRVVMSPQHTKAFLRLLTENMASYEEKFGAVPDIDITNM